MIVTGASAGRRVGEDVDVAAPFEDERPPGLAGEVRRVLPQMLERRRGHIVVVGSILGYAATPPLTAYATTKFALGASPRACGGRSPPGG